MAQELKRPDFTSQFRALREHVAQTRPFHRSPLQLAIQHPGETLTPREQYEILVMEGEKRRALRRQFRVIISNKQGVNIPSPVPIRFCIPGKVE